MDLGLKDKVVVITGGTAGIGEACALAFSREGAHVAVCGRTQKRIAAFKERCAQAGADVFVKQADAGQAEELQAFADAVVSRFGTIDVWINNAGINVGKRLMEITPEDWQQTVAVNLSGVLFGTQIAARAMGEKGGVILNASSFASLIPSVGGTMYGATKAAVSNMTKTMAAELAPQHIRVNAYIPGIIDTPMNAERIADDANHALINAIALHRVGTADEMAQALVFLASDQASYITGTAIEVSGGKYAVQNSEILWG
ncbi:SDR family NAD(P)-dependent oxidoreductase [Megasphaera hominis]|jgi:3-oxoacyl-[acyl-carrier protein] reductase|uniref:SDR family oxidoreductase n=1 Tax=Megasphaera hominis TaxID=159836 RepID=A0ABR6VH36_9FIRM|nr:SDR family oxidoreductase [Megasphaera hominis]MBC3535944.1 SDR family oxidoreductase [Megasphaera hominis]